MSRLSTNPSFILRLAAILFSLAFAQASQAVPILVDSAADNLIAGDGLCTLREAIGNANWDQDFTSGDCEPGLPGMDTIQIQPGLPTIVLNGTELELIRSMAIIGPAAGQQISGNGVSRVFNVSGSQDPAGLHEYRFENLHIINGRTSSSVSNGTPLYQCAGGGAGLCAVAGGVNVQLRVVMRNVEFRSNLSTIDHPNNHYGTTAAGGAAYFGHGIDEVDISGALFAYNEAEGVSNNFGGAIAAEMFGSLRLANIQFLGNSASSAAGAIYAADGQSFTLSRADLANNKAKDGEPVAIWVENTDLTILQDSVLQANLNIDAAQNLTKRGYAMRVDGASSGNDVVLVANTWIDQNLSCGIGFLDVSAFVSNSTFSRNQCDHAGAAMGIFDATVEVTASSILDNINTLPAVRLDGGSLKLESSTVVANHATAPGEAGGIRLDAGTLTLRNTILAENAGSQGSLHRISGTVNASYSQFGDPSGEINGTSSNNLFIGSTHLGAFGDYGCATKAGDSFVGPPVCVPMRPLSTNSPARDQGNAFGAAYDQRGPGFTRSEGGAADIGAYEFQPPLITIEAVDATKDEGNSGDTQFTFRVKRNGDRRSESWAAWHLMGTGSHPADAGDFSAGSWIGGSAYFPANAVEATVNIYVTGDTIAEQNEGFRVNLGALTNGQMGDSAAADGLIINDDATFPVPTLSIAPLQVDVPEGQWLYSTHRFRVTRSQVTSGYCSVEVVLSGDGSFPADDDDFYGISTGLLNTYQMGPGTTHFDIEIPVAGDGKLEQNEHFSVSLQNPSGCFIASGSASAGSYIINDDSGIWIETVTTSAPEGNSGATLFSFRVRRAYSDVNIASVQYTVSGIGISPANAADFVGGSFPSGTVNFAPGQSESVLVIQVAGDLTPEPDEGFRVTLSNAQGGDITPLAHADAIIVNDDVAGGLIFANGFE